MFLHKKRTFLLFAVLISVAFTSCRQSGSGSTAIKTSRPVQSIPVSFDIEDIKERGTLRAIVQNSSTGFFIYRGRPMGFDHDLLNLFAQSIGVDLEIVVTPSIGEAFNLLDSGKGDVIAYSLTVTKERKERVAFTESHYTTRQVLVQQLPDNWRTMTRDNIDKMLIREVVDLAGKEIFVRKNSSFTRRLENLSDEIGSDILVIDVDSAETEEMIEMVSKGEIPVTVADETVALVNASYYPNIDVKTPISFPQNIAWAVRKNSPDLLNQLNHWLDSLKREPTLNVLYQKYFQNRRTSNVLARSDYSTMGGAKISPYDELIKQSADTLNWDWLLLASQIYQESKFNPNATSWAGAIGLMQVVPETGKRFGVTDLTNPTENIKAGTGYLLFLNDLWKRTIKDPRERIKFVLASYNVGLGHVEDARDLAKKYNKDPLKWDDNVEYYLLQKQYPEFYRDPVVKSGYCRGQEPVNYVRQILNLYEQYKQFISV
jgi:membrane-bound lytic murein transglycosylase F